MELKEFQELCLEKLDYYLKLLKKEYVEEKDEVKFHKSKGRDKKIEKYGQRTWDKLQMEGKLPKLKNKKEQLQTPAYQNKKDGLGNPIPNICLKVSTGGGKTLIGVSSIENINFDYFKKNTGLILWIVPTKAIYSQTKKNFKNRAHPYRQILDRAGAGKVKIIEKTDAFSLQDLQEYLCVMLLMLPSANRETKESLRMFKDSGRFISFFPDPDNYQANEELLSQINNLDTYNGKNALGGVKGFSVKHSLGNAIRIARPIVVLDEGHKAYSDLARKTLASLNPKFILELSATPNMKEHLSNVLVSVSGVKLKEEEMIKLPINVTNVKKGDWKKTLCQAYEKLQELEKDSKAYHKKTEKYIRPIMLIQVERTGKDQKDKKFIHSEDAKKYLISHLGISEEAIKIKVSEKDELKDESLLSDTSQVQFIITKQALQEGWDCPFAYVLAILSKAKSKLALTQLIGRILRQPYAQKTSMDSLNESYIFCYNKAVEEVVSEIKKGLQKEGMDDLADYIRTEESDFKKVTAKRKPKFQNTKIFLPRVLCKTKTGSWRKIIYANDILQEIDFSKISYSKKDRWTPENIDSLQVNAIKVDIEDRDGQFSLPYISQSKREGITEIDYAFMIKRLCNFIPHPWDAGRIFDETITTLKSKNISDKKIYLNRAYLLESMEEDIQNQIDKFSEKIFTDKLKNGSLCFKILKHQIDINWTMKLEIDFIVSTNDKVLRREDDRDFQISLFDATYQRHYNELEKQVAWYLDEQSAVKWWHRMVAKQDYHLQGWQKRKVYPDFLAFISPDNKINKLSVLETKGDQLKGNEDTEYKRKLFEVLEKYATNESVSVGDMKVVSEKEQKMIFRILMEKTFN
ncbi:MAG: DEAD/DEAH box helicase family protein [Bdellovibrionales bacterium]|nr:DEAD/DEAH box helicase family protein [Bdellovibrionales bacterium]